MAFIEDPQKTLHSIVFPLKSRNNTRMVTFTTASMVLEVQTRPLKKGK